MMPRFISLIVLAALIACLGLAFVQVVQPFLLPLMVAAVVAILSQPLFRYFMRYTRQQRAWAAAITTGVMVGGVTGPILLATILGAWQLYSWSANLFDSPQSQRTISRAYEELQVHRIVRRIQPFVSSETTPEELEQRLTTSMQVNLPKLLGTVAERTLGMAASTFGLFGSLVGLSISLGMFVTALYFFLADGPTLLAASQDLIPLQREHQDRMLNQFVRVTRAVVIGTFASALAQGLATGIGLYLAGMDRIVLLTIVATLVAIVPMTGTWVVWIPCAVWLLISRESWAFTVTWFSLYNLLFVGSLDNLVRAYVLNSDVKLHPLLAFVSVLGGLQWIGLWGVFIGPVIASCLHALVQIFNEELLRYGQASLPSVVPAQIATVQAIVSPVSPSTMDATPPDHSISPAVTIPQVPSVSDAPAGRSLPIEKPKGRFEEKPVKGT